MAGNNSLELEIHSLFQEGMPIETICTEILSKYEKSDVVSPLEIQSLSHFFLSAGKIDLLFKFYLKCLRKNSISLFPWGYLAEAAMQIEGELSDDLLDIIEMGLKADPQEDSCYKSYNLVQSIPHLSLTLQSSKKKFDEARLQTKTKLIAQLNHNRLYQLKEQEEQTLQQLIKLFPQDIEIKLLHQAHLEKKADEILSRVRAPRTESHSKRFIELHTPEAEEFIGNLKIKLHELADKLVTESPEQIYNLTLLAMQFDLYELALELIQKAPSSFAGEWLRAELLFECGRYVDLLKHIESIENTMTSTPESTYGAIYLKAQAYFGLSQKDIAIQLLESLSNKAPSYRSTEALLHEWKTS